MDITLPKVKMQLVGLDGNAFSILGRFKTEAKRQGWDSDSIQSVLQNAMSGDYNNLLRVIVSVTEDVREQTETEDCNYCGSTDCYCMEDEDEY